MILTVHVDNDSVFEPWYSLKLDGVRTVLRWKEFHNVLSLYYSDHSFFEAPSIDYVPLQELILWLFNQGIVLDWSHVPREYLPKGIER